MSCPVKLIKKTVLIASLIFFTFSLLTTTLFNTNDRLSDARAADVENKVKPRSTDQVLSRGSRPSNVQVQQRRIINGLERIEEKLEN